MTLDEWIIDVDPTSTTPGQKSHHCLICGALTDVTVIPPVSIVVSCDANGDGKITSKDLSLLKRVISGNAQDGTYDVLNADVNNDGKITSKDISALKKLIAQGG